VALSPPESEEISGHQSLAVDKKQAEAEAQVEAAHGPAAETRLERLLRVFTIPLRLLFVLTIPDVTVPGPRLPRRHTLAAFTLTRLNTAYVCSFRSHRSAICIQTSLT
jgi:hypothetical protein